MTWQIFVTLRVGQLRSREEDATPALCCLSIAGVFFLLLKTGGL